MAQPRCRTPKWRNNIITLPAGSGVEAPSSAGSGQAALVFQDNFWFHFRGTARRKRAENGTGRVLVALPDLRLNIQILLEKLVIVPFLLQTWKPACKQGSRSLPDFLQPEMGSPLQDITLNDTRRASLPESIVPTVQDQELLPLLSGECVYPRQRKWPRLGLHALSMSQKTQNSTTNTEDTCSPPRSGTVSKATVYQVLG